MKILITGGAGFIGHNLAIYLKDKGFDVVSLDTLERSTRENVDRLMSHGIPLIKGDVKDGLVLGNALNAVDIVIHAAAYIDVAESMSDPVRYINNNVVGTTTVVYESLKHGASLIFISSAAVYGDPIKLPIPEDHPLRPLSPYGLSKVFGEEVVRFFGSQGLKYVIIRPFNIYGPGQTSAYAGVIMRFIERARQGLPPVIYGDGEQTRDFIHVNDLARLMELVIEKKPWGEVFNAGTGKPTRIIDLAKLVMRLFNVKGEPIFTSPRPGDIKHSYADTTKASTLLGFKPSIDLEDGLRRLLSSYQV